MNKKNQSRIKSSFDKLKIERVEYFRKFSFDAPVIFFADTFREMACVGQILYKCILHMTNHYNRFLQIMPRSERDIEIMEICNKYPYDAGTFRTDFVVNKDNQIKLIEMGTRHPFDGYFISGFFNEISLSIAPKQLINEMWDVYPQIFNYLEKTIGKKNRICIIKGNDRLEEFNFYPALFKEAGYKITVISVEDITRQIEMLTDSWVIEELTVEEITALPLEVIHVLAELGTYNPVNVVLTTHDKRFFHALNQKELTDEILNEEEKKLLGKHLVPTFIHGKNMDEWRAAYRNKEGYILKPYTNGRSEGIVAGVLSDEDTWKDLFDSGKIKKMILQPYIPQKKFSGKVGSEQRDDYVTGTLLYINSEFFGPGLYRTSSVPVSNLYDFRKMGQFVSRTNKNEEGLYYL